MEAVAILIVLRLWSHLWQGARFVLHIQADNVAALTLMAKMQPRSARLGLIAREVSLDVAAGLYAPDVLAHIPGIANVAADSLSRQFEARPPTVPASVTPTA